MDAETVDSFLSEVPGCGDSCGTDSGDSDNDSSNSDSSDQSNLEDFCSDGNSGVPLGTLLAE